MVWDRGVLHSGPRIYADKFSYDQLNDAAVLWDKIALVSTRVQGASCGIVFLYDPFVAAGAAVAFPGRNSVNCPAGWMTSSLDYNSFVQSGSWGNMHEYNHNFQGWGLPGGGEVTNNGLNVVEYSLFTKVSAARAIGSTNEGMGGWNRYTSASFSVRQIGGGGVTPEYPLSIYSTLMHSFGQDNFVKAASTSGTDKYFNKWADLVHYDMTYFSKLVAANFETPAYEMSAEAAATMKEKNYPVFVPVASIYQTGRTYEYDGGVNVCETVQPYLIKYNEEFAVDLRPYTFANGYYQNGSIALPAGLTYEIKKVSTPRYGSIKPSEAENVYLYAPDPNHMKSDKIYVTLEISGTDASTGVVIAPTTVDLVLEFEQTHEMDKNVLERTVYKPTDAASNATIQEAFANNFANYEITYQGNNVNSSQHSNAEIWGPHDQKDFGSIAVLEGKIRVTLDGDYSIGLRGRKNVALYVSLDGGKTYELALSLENEDISDKVNLSKTKKYEGLQSGDWVYFKALVKIETVNSYVAVSWGKWEAPQGTMDDNGNYVDDKGNIITSTEPTLSLAYATGYRKTYEDLNAKFESEYFYTRDYAANYTIISDYSSAKVVSSSECFAETPAENILKDDGSPVRGVSNASADKPFEITVDMGQTVTAQRVIIKGYVENNVTYIPVRFVLSAGDDLNDLKVISDAWRSSDAANKDGTVAFNLQEVVSFRYYKLEILKSTNNNQHLPQLSHIQFVRNITGGELVSPDDDIITYKGNWSVQNAQSNFGHIYQGKNASAEFEFYGRAFIVNSYFDEYMDEFEVMIDGKVVATVDLSADKNAVAIAYVSPELEFGKHKVVIRSKKLFNIESIALR
ncbi:MAG: M60 family metallopeptidase, partial [Corallococcus sp.]|nr:M60 family metallopeptidase [Corallococcus sp.]